MVFLTIDTSLLYKAYLLFLVACRPCLHGIDARFVTVSTVHVECVTYKTGKHDTETINAIYKLLW
nr:hypothetical protein PsAHV6-041 [Psittacid alphaherpesvirus 6]